MVNKMQVSAYGETAKKAVEVNGNREDVRKLAKILFDDKAKIVTIEADQYDNKLTVRAAGVGYFLIDKDLNPESASLVCWTPNLESEEKSEDAL